MFGIGWLELVVIAFIALVVLGPERLPKYAQDAGRLVRQLRRMAQDATSDLRSELGPEMADIDIRDLHPKKLVAGYLFGGDEELARDPFGLADDGREDGLTPVMASDAPARRTSGAPLMLGELPPYDLDAT